jgi:hypothetical protein
VLGPPINCEHKRKEARALSVKAHEREAQRDYDAALNFYRQSLALYNDEAVETAYYTLLAITGPQ